MTPLGDVHATLVGLEHYGKGIASLEGPASQVLDLAQWVIEGGADPDEVVAFLSEPDGRDQDTAASLSAIGLSDTNIRAGTFATIRAHCIQDLRHRKPANLLWFWSGHGFLFRQSYSRVLYAADTSIDDPRAWDITSILRHLRSTTMDRLDRQLVLFNVCAEGTGSGLLLETLPDPPAYKTPLHQDSFYQEAISAAPDEQFVRTGEFADLVLSRLRTTSHERWPPPELAAEVKQESPGSFNLSFGHDSEIGDDLESPEIQRALKSDLEAGDIVAIVGGHARGPDCADQTVISEMLAKSEDVGYPFPDPWVLTHVAEFLARRGQNHDPERRLARTLDELADETRLAQAARNRLRLLAKLPIEVYLTTAYDHLLERALDLEGRRPVSISYSPRNAQLAGPRPTVDEPLVFHLYGRVRPPDEHGDPPAVSEFDVHQRNRQLAADGAEPFFPPSVRAQLQKKHLYVGFDLRDRTLRGLLHALQDARGRGAIGYAIEPHFETVEGADERAARAFVDRYLEEIGPCKQVRVLWDFPDQLIDDVAGRA